MANTTAGSLRVVADAHGADDAFATAPRTIVALARMVDLALDEVDLTLHQFRLLSFCAREPTSPTEVARWFAVKKQSVTDQLESLAHRGYLSSVRDERDGRRRLLEVTPAGTEVLRDAEHAITVYLDVVLGTLGAKDEAAARRGLAKSGVALSRIWKRSDEASPPRPLTGWMRSRALGGHL